MRVVYSGGHARAASPTAARFINAPRQHLITATSVRPQASVSAAAAIAAKRAAKPNLLTRILTISSVPYTAYVPEPSTFLHAVSAEAKQIWAIGVLAIVARASTPMQLTLVAVVASITALALPARLCRPQLTRLAGLCAFIFAITVFGSDVAAPILSDRAAGAAAAADLPASMADAVVARSYRYVMLNLGPFSVTKRSFSLAVTVTALTFLALQSASLCLVTTPPERMARAVGRMLAPLRFLCVPVNELVLTVLLALRFMATVFEEARNLCLGLASRGIDWKLVGTRGTLGLAIRTAGRLFTNLLSRSDSIAVAMTARGFIGPERHVLHLEMGGREAEQGKAGQVLGDVGALACLAGLVALSRVLV